MLIKMIQKSFPDKSDSFYSSVFELCILYSVRSLTAFEFQRRLTELLGQKGNLVSAKAFRLLFIDSCYCILTLKLFVTEYVSRGYSPNKCRKTVKRCLEKYHVDKADYILFLRFYRNGNIRARLKTMFTRNSPIMTVNEAKREFAEMYDDLYRYCNFLSYKKLTFIVNSNNMSYGDVNNELMYKACKSYYMLVPTGKSRQHIVNYLKLTIKNHTTNIISKYKFQKNDRMQGIKGSDGVYTFVMQVTSENQLRVSLNDDDGADERSNIMHGSTLEKGYAEVDNDATMSALKRIYRDKQRRLLELILGDYDEEFTEFLVAKRKLSALSDNVAFFYKNAEEYKVQACKFLNIDLNTCNNFLQRVYSKHIG